MACLISSPECLDLKIEAKTTEYQLSRVVLREKIRTENLPWIESILKDKELTGLKRLWETKNQTDVNLVVGETLVAAHKFILVASSDYFRAMFSGDFAEADCKDVKLIDIDTAGLEKVLAGIYGGSLVVTDTNVQKLLDTADKLQIKEIIDVCENFAIGAIDTTNCFELLQLSEMYTLTRLNMSIESFIIANFLEITEHSLYPYIQSDALISFISNDEVDLPEVEIFKGTLKWFKVNPCQKKEDVLFDVLKHIRFTYMTPLQIREHVLGEKILTKNPQCLKMVEMALDYVDRYKDKNYSRPIMETSNPEQPRGKLSVAIILPEPNEDAMQFRQAAIPHLFMFGASTDGTINMRDINAFKSEADFAVFSMNMLTMGNSLFILGAKQLDEDRQKAKMMLLQYNTQSGEWTTLAEPFFPPLVVTTSIINKNDVYVIGGATYTRARGVAQHTFQADCYKYSVENNTWSSIARYPNPVAHPAACSFGDDIYVIGGGGPTVDTWDRDKVYAYSTTTNTWTAKSSLITGRSGHRVCSLGGKIYAVGGRNPFRRDVPVCEVYDPEENTWTSLDEAPIPQPVASFNLLAHEENIIILGGGDEGDEHHSKIQTLNTRTLKWTVHDWTDEQPYFVPTGSIHNLPLMRARMSCGTRSEYTPRKPEHRDDREEPQWIDTDDDDTDEYIYVEDGSDEDPNDNERDGDINEEEEDN